MFGKLGSTCLRSGSLARCILVPVGCIAALSSLSGCTALMVACAAFAPRWPTAEHLPNAMLLKTTLAKEFSIAKVGVDETVSGCVVSLWLNVDHGSGLYDSANSEGFSAERKRDASEMTKRAQDFAQSTCEATRVRIWSDEAGFPFTHGLQKRFQWELDRFAEENVCAWMDGVSKEIGYVARATSRLSDRRGV